MGIQLRAVSRVLARLVLLLGAARSTLPNSGRRSARRKQLDPPASARLAGQRNAQRELRSSAPGRPSEWLLGRRHAISVPKTEA